MSGRVPPIDLVLTPAGAQYFEALEQAVEHVLRYGKLGKQSQRRLREALEGPGE